MTTSFKVQKYFLPTTAVAERKISSFRVKFIEFVEMKNTTDIMTPSYILLTLWRPLLPYGYSYKASCARLG